MIRLTLAAAVLAALALPTLAAAKEPSQASISGPGFHKTLKMRDGGDFSSTPIGRLTTDAGFFPSVVGQSPDPMLARRPAGRLGPRYTIVWTVPADRTTRVKQDVYPYATGGAVTYTRPGQPIFDSTTTGGWYPGGTTLKYALTQLGLPAREQRASGGGTNLTRIGGLAVLGVLGAAGVVVLARRRQLGQRSPSTSSTELPAGSRT
jgi:hypothetical protein